jgi:hypothetical protein
MMFDYVDQDQDGTIARKELGPRISKRDFIAADLNHDGALTKDDCDLRSPAGCAPVRLIH